MESKIITLPKTAPLTERISEVNKQVAEWLTLLEMESDVETEDLRLSKCELDDKGYTYQYEITTDKEASMNKTGG